MVVRMQGREAQDSPKPVRRMRLSSGVVLALATLLGSCTNNPQPSGLQATNTLFSAFSERSPRYLDPTASYSNNETPVTYQVYEPLYGYHYLKRPYTLIPKAASAVVAPKYFDKAGQPLADDAAAELIATSVYDVPIEKGIRYAPHPAFAKDAQGAYLYHDLQPGQLGDKRSPLDFVVQGTRELVAEDYVYAMKRHATTRIVAPIYGIFSEYVLGLKEYGELIRAEDKKLRAALPPAALDKPFLDFRKYPLEGVSAPDSHTLRIKIHGKYPQWKYWLAMTFMAPVPWEADKFYSQPGMARNGLTLNVWPVGTGPYMLVDYVQDRRHVLKKNPNYRGVPYPCDGMPEDKALGLLDDCGKTMPFIDSLVFTSEKEAVPLKAKFVQGYYDVPEIERTEFGVEYSLEMEDSDRVKRDYTEKGFKLPRTVDISNWYVGFNWLDPVVGKGATPEQQLRNRKLRQALGIAIDWEEYNRIFPRKGGEVAMGPLPGGLVGSRHGSLEGVNPNTHRVADAKLVRRPLDDAKKLLAEAGYPDGRDEKNGKPLVLYYDYQRVPTPEIKSELDWMIKQYAKLGVQLEIRATDYNQFQDKMRKGTQQIFFWGWLADYPDAENYLFLLYGPTKTRNTTNATSCCSCWTTARRSRR
jgi:ABC-type transport system substrate-binding protein